MRKNHIIAMTASSLAIVAAGLATPAFAQSTGAVDFENTIVVTAAKQKAINGVQILDTPKAKEVLNQEFISKSNPGQSIDDVINMIPGVAFNNADPYGSSGGTLFIRGFDNSRIAQTFDGMPLNDTGNYALYTNQQLDIELIDQVSVNLGSTDVDSPTAAASGSTVNYRSRNPFDTFTARAVASVGEYNYRRVFGVVDTGILTKSGLKAWISGSTEYNEFLPNTGGHVWKQQVNAKVYQPIGDNGDFISLAGHFNFNQNNFAPSIYMYMDNSAAKPVNSSSSGRYPTSWADAGYTINCADTTSANKSTTGYGAYECRYNPSRTANLRMNMRFTLADQLILTIDPSFQYTKANGGGTGTLSLGSTTIGGQSMVGYFYNGASPYYYAGTGTGTMLVGNASETETNRIGLQASLRYQINPDNMMRVAYAYDRGRHKQTGELTPLDMSTGLYDTYFPIDMPILDANGNAIEKRNRLSYAILHQVSGEYNGKFFDERLDVLAGVRAPFFTRNLNNFCFTLDASGDVSCMAPQYQAAYAAANPTAGAPQHREYNFSKVLPNVGFTFKVIPTVSAFANYSVGMQVPGTDTLYNNFYYSVGSGLGTPVPETSDNFDFGLRYRKGKVSASLAGWYTLFHNKITQLYNQDTQTSIYSNLGDVEKYGMDATLAWQADKHWSLYGFYSWNKSRIVNNLLAGNGATNSLAGDGTVLLLSDGAHTYYQTAGKREGGVPTYTAGARVEANFDPLQVTVSAKHTGKRYTNNQNLPTYASGVEVTPAAISGYTTVDLSLRYKLNIEGLKERNSYFQINVQNLFDKFYVGGFAGSGATSSATSVQSAYLGVPRTISGTFSVEF